jgi:hypothetical protein
MHVADKIIAARYRTKCAATDGRHANGGGGGGLANAACIPDRWRQQLPLSPMTVAFSLVCLLLASFLVADAFVAFGRPYACGP